MPRRRTPPTLARRSAFAVLASAGAAVAVTGLAVTAVASPAPDAVPAPPGVKVVKLVSDQAGVAQLRDTQLVNAWGMAHAPGQPIWVSDNGTGVSTIYAGGTPGKPVQKVPLVVTIPGGSPTGQVYNGSSSFRLPSGYPAHFIFAGEDGDLSGWYSGTSATAVSHDPKAVYKGIAIDPRSSGPLLLVADFRTGHVDVFNSSFHRTTLPGKPFTDRKLPAGYAPFDVAVIGKKVYVTYAVQDAAKHDDVAGAGHGIIDVYGRGGQFRKRLVSHGALNSPWGMVVAPPTFGSLAGSLLVGNFGNGRIHAYDRTTGALLATLRTKTGRMVRIDGLWGLTRGDAAAGGRNAIWFSAGPDGEAHGLLGVLRAS